MEDQMMSGYDFNQYTAGTNQLNGITKCIGLAKTD